MSDEITRREFVVGVSALGGVLALCSTAAAGSPQSPGGWAQGSSVRYGEARVLLFDPEHAEACRKSAEAGEGCARFELAGDRVRFAAQFFSRAEAPLRIEGLTSYADYIVLSGCAAEHGYRVIAEAARGSLTQWAVERRTTF